MVVLSVSDVVYDLAGLAVALTALPLLPLLYLSRFGNGLGERLGRLPATVRGLHRPIWVHAASVGEVLSTEPLLRELRRVRPDLAILVTTTSLTGHATARDKLAADAVMLLPADVRFIVRPVMRRLRPRCLIIVETEIWPGLIAAAAAVQSPVVMLSARVSPRAVRRYRWIGPVMRRTMQRLTLCVAQTSADAARFAALGVPAERLHVTGSLKFATSLDAGTGEANQRPDFLPADRPILVAASTHPGEEEVVLDAFVALQRTFPRALLVLAPRRPERFDSVAALLHQRGTNYSRRSQLSAPPTGAVSIILLDSIGDLRGVFPYARAAFVGGTIANVGGHNVLEPAAAGVPVAFGPRTENVADAAQLLLDHGGGTRVHNEIDLGQFWSRMMDDAEQVPFATAARAVVARHMDVARRSVELLQPFLESRY